MHPVTEITSFRGFGRTWKKFSELSETPNTHFPYMCYRRSADTDEVYFAL